MGSHARSPATPTGANAMPPRTIIEMLKALKPVLKNRKKAGAILEKYWADKIAIIWTEASAHRAANECQTALTRNEARRILRQVLDSYDPQDGVAWSTVTTAIKESGLGRNLAKNELRRFIEKDIITIQKVPSRPERT